MHTHFQLHSLGVFVHSPPSHQQQNLSFETTSLLICSIIVPSAPPSQRRPRHLPPQVRDSSADRSRAVLYRLRATTWGIKLVAFRVSGRLSQTHRYRAPLFLLRLPWSPFHWFQRISDLFIVLYDMFFAAASRSEVGAAGTCPYQDAKD